MTARELKKVVANSKRTAGFTLIELLVVIAIIALLVSILLPSLKQANEIAKQAACLSNMRNFAFAHSLYAEDHGTYVLYNLQPHVPGWRPKEHWYRLLLDLEYVTDIGAFFCPDDKTPQNRLDSGRTSYGMTMCTTMTYAVTMASDWWHVKPRKPEEFEQPAETVLMVESMWVPENTAGGGCYVVYPAANTAMIAYPRHQELNCNALWMDGHASSVKSVDPAEPYRGLYAPDAFGTYADPGNVWTMAK